MRGFISFLLGVKKVNFYFVVKQSKGQKTAGLGTLFNDEYDVSIYNIVIDENILGSVLLHCYKASH